MTPEHGIARLLKVAFGEGSGLDLDGRDVEVAVARLEKKLARRPARSARVRPVSKKKASQPRLRDVVVPEPADRCALVGEVDPGFRRFVTELACAVDLTPVLGGADPCHRLTKRNNGDWVELDDRVVGNIFPARRKHHQNQSRQPISHWEEETGWERGDLAQICAAVGRGYLEGWTPDALSVEARRCGGYQNIDFDSAKTPKNLEAPW